MIIIFSPQEKSLGVKLMKCQWHMHVYVGACVCGGVRT